MSGGGEGGGKEEGRHTCMVSLFISVLTGCRASLANSSWPGVCTYTHIHIHSIGDGERVEASQSSISMYIPVAQELSPHLLLHHLSLLHREIHFQCIPFGIYT